MESPRTPPRSAAREHCPDCHAAHTERHHTGCPTLERSLCHWCGRAAGGHDTDECFERIGRSYLINRGLNR